MDRYVALESNADEVKIATRQIVAAFDAVGSYVRFVEVQPELSTGVAYVHPPSLQRATAAVEQALVDAQLLLQTGALGSVDRLHTAFKGYLRQIISAVGIQVAHDAELPAIFRALRTSHPRLVAVGPGASHITRIINSLATIVDAISPLRNDHSLAHDNTDLLREPEAGLYVNSVRTLFNYIQARLESSDT